MLDIQIFRDNPDLIRQGLIKRHDDPSIVDQVINLDQKRRELLQEVERLRAERNQESKAIGKTKDPTERHNLAQARPELRAQLSDELRRRREASGHDALTPGLEGLPVELRERLKSLGYAE